MAKNIIDKAIEYVAPGYALKRTQARNIIAYYEAAKTTRKQKLTRATNSPNGSTFRL